MKSKIMFIALYSAAFMFPSIGSVDIADAETDLSHCAAFSGEPKGACEDAARNHAPVVGDISHCDAFSGPALAACVDAAHGSAPAPFDDGLMGAPAMGAPGTMGHAPGTQGKAPRYNQSPTGGYAPGTQGVSGMDKRSDANNATGEVDHCADFAPGTPPHQSCVQREHGGR